MTRLTPTPTSTSTVLASEIDAIGTVSDAKTEREA